MINLLLSDMDYTYEDVLTFIRRGESFRYVTKCGEFDNTLVDSIYLSDSVVQKHFELILQRIKTLKHLEEFNSKEYKAYKIIVDQLKNCGVYK